MYAALLLLTRKTSALPERQRLFVFLARVREIQDVLPNARQRQMGLRQIRPGIPRLHRPWIRTWSQIF